jgi:hypothetical protein
MADIRKDLRYIFAHKQTQQLINEHGHFHEYYVYSSLTNPFTTPMWSVHCERCEQLVAMDSTYVEGFLKCMENGHG